MFRKLSGGAYAPRSSQPKRISDLIPETVEDKKMEAKKSMIPVPRGSARASSADDVRRSGRSSSVEDKRMPRALSADRDLQASAKVTPASKMKLGQSLGSVMTTLRRTGRKDTRILSDKAFQNRELCKVREYLMSENLLDPLEIEDIGSKMSLKLFVSVMEVLLNKYFPDIEITMSNYVEVIPNLLKKLKYPGKIVRSSLVAANTSHSWQHILGAMSWLVNLLSASEIKWYTEEELLSAEQIAKMHNFNSRRYREFCAGKTDAFCEEDEEFFGTLVGCNSTYLKEEATQLKNSIEDLERELNNPIQMALIAKLQQRVDQLKQLRYEKEKADDEYSGVCLQSENVKENVDLLHKRLMDFEEKLQKGIDVKKIMEEHGGLEQLEQGNMKCKAEILQLENRKECHAAQIEELCNDIYTKDLGIAKTRKLLDKEITEREACVRELACMHPDGSALDCSIFHNHRDARQVMKEYKRFLEETLVASKGKVEELQRKVLEIQQNENLLFEELKNMKILEENKKVDVLTAEENLKQAKEESQREEEEFRQKETASKDLLQYLDMEIEIENTKIEEAEERTVILEKELEELKKENKETKETYKKNLATMAEKLEAHMTKLINLYFENFSEYL